MSEAGIEANSCVALTNVVSRALPFTFTTALGANPPPFTVNVNAGPPVATTEGEIDVISTPKPVSAAVLGVIIPLFGTLRVAVSALGGDVGVKLIPTSHFWPGLSENAEVYGTALQAAFPPAAMATRWKSGEFVPLILNPGAATLSTPVPAFVSVAFIVTLVVP